MAVCLKLTGLSRGCAGNIRSICTSFSSCKEFQSEHERLEAGPQDRIIHGQKYENWRKRWGEREGEFKSKLGVFAMDGPPTESTLVKFRQLPLTWDLDVWNKYMADRREARECLHQSYVDERHRMLGSDLAATHFICFRGGAIRFMGSNDWIKEDPTSEDTKIPNLYVEGMFVEAIDCEKLQNEGIRYEGLENFDNLEALKWLSFKNNVHFNDWCMDRIAGLNLPSLSYLDVTNCPVTYRGLAALPKLENFKNFKLLKVSNKSKCDNLEHVCSMLENYAANLLIAINYD